MSHEEKEEGSKQKEGEFFQEEEEPILVFQFNDNLGEFEELEFEEDLPLYELLDSDFILLFIDPNTYRVWVWHGANTTTRMKFISAKLAPSIRDRYGIAYKIAAVDEGNETEGFKILVGLKDKFDYETEKVGPAYEGKEEDLELLKELTREKIVLLLEKAGEPEGYKRKMVIVKNKLYGYREYYANYMGSVIRKRELIPLKEEVPDGPYLASGLTPRIVFSFNNVVLTELLEKEDEEVIEEKKIDESELSDTEDAVEKDAEKTPEKIPPTSGTIN